MIKIMCMKMEICNLHYFSKENAFRDWKGIAMAGKVCGSKIKFVIMVDVPLA